MIDPFGLECNANRAGWEFPWWEVLKGSVIGVAQDVAVVLDMPGQVVEWMGIGERPLKYLGAYEDSDLGIRESRIAGGIFWIGKNKM